MHPDQPTPVTTPRPIIDVEISNFMQDVIEQSQQRPVLVAFYMAGSEACMPLLSTLENIANSANNAFILAKADIQQTQQIAMQMQIQSVPTTVLFVQGRPVDAFAGPKDEAEIKQFLGQHIPDLAPSEEEMLSEQAEHALAQQDYAQAAALYSQLMELKDDSLDYRAGLIISLSHLNELEAAETLLKGVPTQHQNHIAINKARAIFEIKQQLGDVKDIDELRTQLNHEPDNHQLRFDLALSYWSQAREDEAALALLHIIQHDRAFNDDAARKQLVKFFEMKGGADPFTINYRKKLSSILFS